MNRCALALIIFVASTSSFSGIAQQPDGLEQQLQQMSPKTLLSRVQQRGDAKRGALIFYKSAAACAKCHESESERSPLGPKLTAIGKDVTEQAIVDAILYPSRTIKQGYETISVLTTSGDVVNGLVVDEQDDKLILREAQNLEKEITINQDTIEARKKSSVSMMPKGLASSLRTEREFYDLVQYVFQVARGGEAVASKLKPSADQLIVKDDTRGLDHAGILANLSERDFNAGQRIYQSHCVNCHGSDGNQPALASARAFGTQSMKYNADPFGMLMTLTKGNGLMGAMQHLSPKERYQVIHFIREAFMKERNPGYEEITPEYLASLPKGTRTGEIENDGERDYGAVLGSQLGSTINNSLSFRLPGEVTVNYDLHRFRLGGVWQGGFLDLSQTQHYRQRGERMPRPSGVSIPGLDDYGWQLGDSFDIPDDAKPPRGPVRTDLAKYRGHYLHGDQAILSYEIAEREVLESIEAESSGPTPRLVHSFRIQPGSQTLRLSVGKQGQPGKAGLVTAGEQTVSSANGSVSNHLIVAPAQRSKAFENAPNNNAALFIERGPTARSLDLGVPDRTIAIRFRTRKGGTLIASSPEKGEWAPNGKTLFVRGKRLVFDIGWVGAISSKSSVADGEWHTAVLQVGEDETRLYVDGKLEAAEDGFRRPPVRNHVLKIGATATNFGGDLDGEVAWAAIYDGGASRKQLKDWTSAKSLPSNPSLWSWTSSDRDSIERTSPENRDLRQVSRGAIHTMAGVVGDTAGMTWTVENDGRLMLTIPPSDRPLVFKVIRTSGPLEQLPAFRSFVDLTSTQTVTDPQTLTRGGPRRWPEELVFTGSLGRSANGYALDTIPVPFENPWNAWLRTSALDFFDDGRCVVTTHGGDVYIVSGIDDELGQVTWKRYVAGLFEPFGVRVVDDMIYVTCRDGLKRLHDFDDNGEADFVEAFWNDDDVSSMFHAYNFDLQTDSKGNFYFAKAGQYTNHHRPGTIMRVPPEGGRADVVAWGIRTPNGMGKLNDDRFTVSDNQGPWMPAGKVSLITPNAFLGNMPINKEQDQWLRAKYGGELPTTFDEPFIWLPQEVDNSCGGQIWASDDRWGPLSGRLIHSSYGKGWLYYLSLQEIEGEMQSSIVTLPHQWEAGVMRLRINPKDGQMYGVGLSGWQGPTGGKDGCLQRLRYTGTPVRMLKSTRVVPGGVELEFNFELGSNAIEPAGWSAEMWDYLWSRRYGSDQYSILRPGEKGRDSLAIKSIKLSDDHRTVTLMIPQLAVCDQLHLTMELDDQSGQTFAEEVYFTIHHMPN